MPIDYQMHHEVPIAWLEQWSLATQTEPHLTPESPESLADNLLVAAFALDGEQPVGMAGIIRARTRQGHGICHGGKEVAELGGAYVVLSYRGQGIWRELAKARIAYARELGLELVCISSNPTVQTGLVELGAQPLTSARLMDQLCLGCQPASTCTYCPLAPGNAWQV